MITLLLAAATAAELTWEARAELDSVGVAENAGALTGGRDLTSLGLAGSVDVGKYLGVDLGWHHGARRTTLWSNPEETDTGGGTFDARYGAHRIELGGRAQIPVRDVFAPYVGVRGGLAMVRHTIDQDLDQLDNTIEQHRGAVTPGLELVGGFSVATPVRTQDDPYGASPRIGFVMRLELGWSTYARFDLGDLGDTRLGGATGTFAVGARYR